MIESIYKTVMRRDITRLCHFTSSRNLTHIVTNSYDLLATAYLENDPKSVFNPTDPQRLDGFKDHICCSIEYPNSWYLRKAKNSDLIFSDWIIFFIKPHYLWSLGTLFCPRNAATERGRLVGDGVDAFDAMFAHTIVGAHNKTYTRTDNHPLFLPTDEQAEVLIPDRVFGDDLLGIGVQDKGQAKREIARIETLNGQTPHIVIAPDLFNPDRLSRKLRSGSRPTETDFRGHQDD